MPSPLNFIRNSSIWPEPFDDSSFSGMRISPSGAVAEVEQALVEVGPERHAAAVDVVRQVVDHLQAVAGRAAVDALDELEVDVVDGLAVLVAVDQVDRHAADALDRGQAQLHRAGGNVDGLRAERQRALVGLVRVLHAEREAAGRRAVFGREVRGQAARLAVDDEVDPALAVQQHVLGAVARHQREAQHLEVRLDHVGRGRGELHELEALQAHRVVEQVGHGGISGGLSWPGIIGRVARSISANPCVQWRRMQESCKIGGWTHIPG